MKREDDWRIHPPQFSEVVLKVGRSGETLRIPAGSRGRALNLSVRLRAYCRALRNAPESEVGELRTWAPLVSFRVEGSDVIACPQAESVNAKLVEQALKGLNGA